MTVNSLNLNNTQCLIFNRNTNDQFKKDIVHDSIQKFNSLIQGPDYKIHNQIMCSWFSCLLVDKFITADQYLQIFDSIINSNNLEISEKVSIIYTSLKISGETIDNKEHPLTECCFLFTYLNMEMEKCSLLLQTKIKDLFELRNFGWNLEEYKSSKEIQDYINEKKKIYDNLISFLLKSEEIEESNFDDLINIIQQQKITEKPNEFEEFLRLINSIANHSHRDKFLFNKIYQIIQHYQKEIKQTFSNIEMFNIFGY